MYYYICMLGFVLKRKRKKEIEKEKRDFPGRKPRYGCAVTS